MANIFPIKKGTKAAYEAINEKDARTVYILTDAPDENNMFLGTIPIGKGSSNKVIADVSYNSATNILTYTYTDTTTVDIELNGSLINDIAYDKETHTLTVTNIGGDEMNFELFKAGDTDTVEITFEDETFSAEVKLSDNAGNALSVETEDGHEGLYVDVSGKANRAVSPTAGNLALVDAEGNVTDSGYSADDLLNIPVPPPNKSEVVDITPMMDIPTSADISALLFKSASNGKDTVRLSGFDSSGSTSDLVITPAVGFGAHYYRTLVCRELNAALQPTDYIIEISVDDGDETPSQIKIPYGIKNFDITYFLTKSGGHPYSYYITSDNVMNPFDIFNTPFANFLGTATSVTINGKSVAKNTIKSIYFGTTYNSITAIGDNFLYGYTALNSADFDGLINAVSIGAGFLQGCTALNSVDLSGLSNVTSIGNNFMYGCTGLVEVDLSGFGELETIGNQFFQGNINLLSLDFSAFESLITIGTNFCYGCSKLETIDISGFTALTAIGISFLQGCIALTGIDLSSLSELTSLPNNFMYGCTSLTEIDFSPLVSVISFGNEVMRASTKLEKAIFTGLDSLLTIGSTFLYGCSKLKEVDLSGLGTVTTIADYFLATCTTLNKIQIGGVNWATKTVTTTNAFVSVPNDVALLLYADTADLAVAFKNKTGSKLSTWSIVINGSI